MSSSPVIIPASTLRNMPQQARNKYLSTLPGYRRKAVEEYFDRVIGKAAWLVLLEEGGYSPQRIEKEYLFENFPRNGIEYNKEELEANDSYMLFIPETVDGEKITVKFFERLGFKFIFNNYKVYGYEHIPEQFSSIPAPKGIFAVRANTDPASTNKCLQKQRKMIPEGYSLSHPLVEVTKNVLLSVLGHEVNKNTLARCVCWDTDSVSIVGGVDGTDKKMRFYLDDSSLSGKLIGASCARSIIA